MNAPALALTIVHVWIGAAWLGGVWLSLTALHGRGPSLFARDADFERTIAGFSRGNRRVLIGCALAMAATGAALWVLRGPGDGLWQALVAIKAGLLVANAAVFAYVSWVLWPARLFALPAELPALRRRQTRLRVASLVLLGASAALGVVAHAARSGS